MGLSRFYQMVALLADEGVHILFACEFHALFHYGKMHRDAFSRKHTIVGAVPMLSLLIIDNKIIFARYL